MTDSPRLTRKAAKFWDAIPSSARTEILANVYCVRCRGAVSIIAASGTLKRGDLVLVKGSRAVRTELVVERLAAEFA